MRNLLPLRLLLMLACLLPACVAVAQEGTTYQGEEGSWTVMVYMVGSDLQSEHGSGDADLEEMKQVGSQAHMNVVVLTGGANSEGWQEVTYSAVVGGGMETLDEWGRVDMAQPATLTEFVTRSIFVGINHYGLFQKRGVLPG